jgi:hypothetical protein
MNSLWGEKREKKWENECSAKKNDDDLLNFLSFSFSCAVYLNNVECSHLSSFGLSWFFFTLKMLPWWWWSSSSSTLFTLIITHERCPTINNNTADLLLHAVCVFFPCIYI